MSSAAMATTDELIRNALDGLDANDSVRLAEALAGIFASEPGRWRQLLMLNGVLPEPRPNIAEKDARRLANRLGCLWSAMQHLLSAGIENRDTVQATMRIVQGALALQKYYVGIAKELKSLKFTRLPPGVQLWRLLGYVEDQHYLTRKEITKQTDALGYRDPYRARASSLTSPNDGSRRSYGQNLDGLCENIELAIRFILHGKAKLDVPDRSEVKSPYNDPDYQKYLILAGIWRVVGDAWANLKFRGWEWLLNKDNQNVCAPSDPTEMLREHVAAIRHDIFIEQRILRAVAVQRDRHDEEKTRKVIDSLDLSTETPAWNGGVDLQSLRYLCETSDFGVFCDKYVTARHYSPLLSKLSVAGIDWKTWYGGSNVLRVLAEAVMAKLGESVDEADEAGPLKRVLVIPAEVLKMLIVACSGLGEEEAKRFLKAIQFDPKRKSLEIWDQPLIPCSADSYFFVPCLIYSGNPARAIENFVDEWGGATFDSRGVPFERYLVDELRNRTDGAIAHSVKVPLGDRDLEFDILFYWKEILFLIEAKCSKSVFSAADYFRAKGQIDKSIDQLLLRRKEIAAVWDSLREKSPELKLPDIYPGPEKIRCVSITNVMDFTGCQQDGIVVTDDSCFFRFFDNPETHQVAMGESGEEIVAVVGRIREKDEPTPEELMAYLASPPQMNHLLRFARPGVFVVPRVSDQTRGFGFVYAEYNPPTDHFDPSHH